MKGTLVKILKTSPYDWISYFKSSNHAASIEENASQIIDTYLDKNKHPKLQIGCGKIVADGWLNTDLVPNSSEVALLDASKKFPFEDNTFDFIYSEHVFEHLKFAGECNMASECFRVLKPNGILRLAIPHVDFLFKIYQNPESPIHKEYVRWALEGFCKDVSNTLPNDDFSMVYVINNFYRDWGHQVLHNFDSLKQLLETFRFSEVERKEIGNSDFEELSGMEKHGDIIPKKFNELETLVVEGRKP